VEGHGEGGCPSNVRRGPAASFVPSSDLGPGLVRIELAKLRDDVKKRVADRAAIAHQAVKAKLGSAPELEQPKELPNWNDAGKRSDRDRAHQNQYRSRRRSNPLATHWRRTASQQSLLLPSDRASTAPSNWVIRLSGTAKAEGLAQGPELVNCQPPIDAADGSPDDSRVTSVFRIMFAHLRSGHAFRDRTQISRPW